MEDFDQQPETTAILGHRDIKQFCGASCLGRAINEETLAFLLPSRARALLSSPPVNSLIFLVDAALRGFSQVVIVNNPLSGLVILIAIFIGSGPWLYVH